MSPSTLLPPSDDQRTLSTLSMRFQGTGRVGNLTPQQEAALHRFREDLEQEGLISSAHDDFTLLRFLRARRFNHAAAKAMFTATEQWRRDMDVDSLVQNFVFPEAEEMAKFYPRFYHKTDRKGRPVYIEQLGGIDVARMFKITTEDRMIKHFIVGYEHLIHERFPACSQAAGERVEQTFTITDLKGLSLRQVPMALGFIKRIAAIAQDNYPELMGKMIIINAPFLFSGAFNMIKPFLDEVTASKIVILGSKYQTELLKYVDPQNLPEEFGGKCRCPEGCKVSDAGPWKNFRIGDDAAASDSERASR
ncbi:uncharacterized protein VTP21DRAFT_3435 [Calcarisporiella thermophila]|uniref:uncharacterized protein n=1 Tax=Calcarisporiella thermophila TaxID=911321 RepID=UPI003743B269